MKVIRNIISILLIIFFISCNDKKISPSINTSISDKYTNSAIDSLMIAHNKSNLTEINPPEILSNQLYKDFPDAKDIDWERSDYIYEVEFEIENTDFTAFYDKDANLLVYKYEIDETELPAVVKNASVAIYPDYHFDDIVKIIRRDDIIYKLELKRNNIEKTILLKKDGLIQYGADNLF